MLNQQNPLIINQSKVAVVTLLCSSYLSSAKILSSHTARAQIQHVVILGGLQEHAQYGPQKHKLNSIIHSHNIRISTALASYIANNVITNPSSSLSSSSSNNLRRSWFILQQQQPKQSRFWTEIVLFVFDGRDEIVWIHHNNNIKNNNNNNNNCISYIITNGIRRPRMRFVLY